MRTVLYGIRLFNDNRIQTRLSYLYETERRGKRVRCWRDREKECSGEEQGLQEEVASVIFTTVEEDIILDKTRIKIEGLF
jgi:hypothetical protein